MIRDTAKACVHGCQGGDGIGFSQAARDGEAGIGAELLWFFEAMGGEGDLEAFAAEQAGIAGCLVPCAPVLGRNGEPVIFVWKYGNLREVDGNADGDSRRAHESGAHHFPPVCLHDR